MKQPDWQSHFQPGEHLLWEGGPLPGLHLSRFQVVKIGLATLLMLLGAAMAFSGFIALFGAESLMAALGVLFFISIGLFFSIMGGWMVAEPFLDPVAQARHNRYALSNRAAFVARFRPVKSVTVHPILASSVVEIEKGGRVQTVRIYVNPPLDLDDYPAPVSVEFEVLADGEKVFHLVRKVIEGKQGATA